uniref:Uncharacterized protein n=1 Tax=Moniliophthora roreri TaxID=221103 RepID=A0A0W0G1J2_MONRR
MAEIGLAFRFSTN